MVTVVLISTGASILPVYRLGGHSGKKNRTSFQYCCGTFRLILSYVCYPWMTTFFLPFPFLLLFLPQKSAEDVSQFDSRFTAQTPIDSPVDFRISESANLNFQVCQTYCLSTGSHNTFNQERIRIGATRVRVCNYVKIKTGGISLPYSSRPFLCTLDSTEPQERHDQRKIKPYVHNRP